MRSTLPTPALLLCALLLALASAREAHAYCRSTTEPPADGCACSYEGLPFYWDDETITYAFNERGFPGVSEAALRQVFGRSFAHWTGVTCEGDPVALSLREIPQSTPVNDEYLRSGSNTNVITHLSEADFLAGGNSRFAFALTSIAYSDTGEILDADIVFNGGRGPFSVCPSRGCEGSNVDLENVATHEIGHFFGLAHSQDEDATMACTADTNDIEKRSLAADDIAGICEIYGPTAIEERAAALRSRSVGPGCQCQLDPNGTRGPAGLALSLALLGLFAVRRRAAAR